MSFGVDSFGIKCWAGVGGSVPPRVLAYLQTRAHVLQAAGYAIYGNNGSGVIDYDTSYLVVDDSATSATSGALADGNWMFGIRKRNTLFEDLSATKYVSFVVSGGARILRPNSPRLLTVTPAAGGTFVLTCEYDTADQVAAPTTIRFYYDNGTGVIDYVTPIGTANITATTSRSRPSTATYTTGALVHGTTYLFVARARTAGGVEDTNTTTASAVADTTGPTSITADSLTVTKVFSLDA